MEGMRKTTKRHRIVGVPVETRTRNLPNTRQKRNYCLRECTSICNFVSIYILDTKILCMAPKSTEHGRGQARIKN
jgi:hypothetical protein